MTGNIVIQPPTCTKTKSVARRPSMSGLSNPYKEAELGVLQEGAWADMLLVDGDLTKHINLLADPQRNFVVVIKNGTIYKNTLHQ